MWWLLSVLLLIPGLVIFGWMSNGMGKSRFSRPLILHRTIPVAIITVVSVSLIGGGLYSLWRANSIICLVFLGVVALITIRGAILSRTKGRAVRFFRAYQQLKIYRPHTPQKELIEETIRLYLKGTQQESGTNSIIKVVCEDNKDLDDMKGVANFVLALEDPNGTALSDFERYMKEADKRKRAIDQAYEKVFAKASPDVKPTLSPDILKRMKEQGFDTDKMSNEQLAALETMQDSSKSHWIAQAFSYAGYGAVLFAIVRLLSLDIWTTVFYLALAAVLMFIGYRIQLHIASKKFREASIRKWAEEQRASANK